MADRDRDLAELRELLARNHEPGGELQEALERMSRADMARFRVLSDRVGIPDEWRGSRLSGEQVSRLAASAMARRK